MANGRELNQFEHAIGAALERGRMHTPLVGRIGQQARQVKAQAQIDIAAALPTGIETLRSIPDRDLEIAQEAVPAQRLEAVRLDHQKILLARIVAERSEFISRRRAIGKAKIKDVVEFGMGLEQNAKRNTGDVHGLILPTELVGAR